MHARTKTRGVLIAALATLLTLVGAGTAAAVVPGGMVFAGCLSSAVTAGCTQVTPDFTGAASNMVISPDGQNAYVATSTSLLTFSRDPASGLLARVAGQGGCFHSGAATGDCRQLALASPTGLAITPNGAALYMATTVNGILEFDRGAGGVLTQKAGAAGCMVDEVLIASPCSKAPQIASPQHMAIDPDGRNLYVASSGAGGSVTALQIDGAGALVKVPNGPLGLKNCVSQSPLPLVDPCLNGAGLSGARELVVNASGSSLYVSGSGMLAAIARDPATGLMALVDGAKGCFATAAGDNCTVIGDLASPNDITLGSAGELYLPATNKGVCVRPLGLRPRLARKCRRVHRQCRGHNGLRQRSRTRHSGVRRGHSRRAGRLRRL